MNKNYYFMILKLNPEANPIQDLRNGLEGAIHQASLSFIIVITIILLISTPNTK
jgi:hypothetical protein